MLTSFKISALPYCVEIDPTVALVKQQEIESWLEHNIGPRITVDLGYRYRRMTYNHVDVWCFRDRDHAVLFDMVWG